MLAKSLVDQIDRLLQSGQLSHRKIAAKLGVGRGTVAAIASGRRGLYGREPLDDGPASVPLTPAERCRQCGYRVYMPCLICRSRDYRERQNDARDVAARAKSAAQKNQSRRYGDDRCQDAVVDYFLVFRSGPTNPCRRPARADHGR